MDPVNPDRESDASPVGDAKMEKNQYQYAPLPTPTSIRLLRVNNRGKDGLLYCTMKTVDLDDLPLYHTLSYTWGNPFPDSSQFRKDADEQAHKYAATDRDPRHAISCDGKLLYPNRNLYEALRSIPADAWARHYRRKDVRNHLRTALHVAAIAGDWHSVFALVRAGVAVDDVDVLGTTALGYAVQSGDIDVVKLLVDAGANMRITDNKQKTPVGMARERGHTAIVEYLEGRETRGSESGPHPEPPPDGPQVWAWIDQICIDQSNLRERSAQVSIMDRIYELSQFTLNWLGREDRYTETAIQTILKYDAALVDTMGSKIIPYCEQPAEIYSNARIPYISVHDWEAIAALFLRRYFRRLWVIQENILSKVSVGYCGPFEVPWEAFVRFAKHTYNRQMETGRSTSTNFINRDEAVSYIEEEVVAVAKWKEQLVSGETTGQPKEMTFESLIFATWSFRASDARDKIYGLYGLLSRIGHPRWFPDYTKSVEQVYAEATQVVMGETRDFRLLSAVIDRTLRRHKDLPSWVPDYGLPFTNMMCAIYNAAGNLPRSPPKPSPWNVLRVAGVNIDSVIQIGNTTSGPGDMAMFFDPCWLELCMLLPSPYHTGQPRTECLWRTLCANQDAAGSVPAPDTFHASFRQMLLVTICIRAREETRGSDGDAEDPPIVELALERVRDFMSKPPMSDLTPDEMQKEFGHPGKNLSGPNHQNLTYLMFKLRLLAQGESSPATPTPEEIAEYFWSINWADWSEGGRGIQLPPEGTPFHNSLRNKYGRRRLFVTAKRHLGLGPASMLEGDEVWVLPGAGAAFVLRKAQGDDSFQLIGEAYVHGVMNGEATGGLEREMRDINLV